MKEQDILACIARQVAEPSVLNDDAYFDSATNQIYTTDMLVEGVHFSLDYFSAEDLGWKAAAVNISDIAAMGGELRFLTIALGLPQNLPSQYFSMGATDFIKGFYQGIQQALAVFGGKIIGGDTVSARDLTLNITAVGQLPVGHTLGRRDGARVGDLMITSGYSGLSEVGLRVLSRTVEDLGNENKFRESRQRHLRPMPRMKEGLFLSKNYERYGLMDTSDGLADGALKIAEASQVRLEIVDNQLPVSPELKAFKAILEPPADAGLKTLKDMMLYGGEDFELLATIPDGDIPDGFTCIGKVAEGRPGAFLVDDNGRVLEELASEKTYQHFPSHSKLEPKLEGQSR